MVIGVGFGALWTVSPPLAAECFGLENFGSVFGLLLSAYGFLSSLLGSWLSGYLLDITQGNFTLVFSYLGAFCVVSAGLILLVRPPRID